MEKKSKRPVALIVAISIYGVTLLFQAGAQVFNLHPVILAQYLTAYAVRFLCAFYAGQYFLSRGKKVAFALIILITFFSVCWLFA